MAAQLLDGKTLAKFLKEELAPFYQEFLKRGITPKLAIMQVGGDEASAVYARSKIKACQSLGAVAELFTFPASTAESEILATLERLNADKSVHGIFIEMPLPKSFHEDRIRQAISPAKDVDAIHPDNLGRMALGTPSFIPCTPLGVMALCARLCPPMDGKHMVILGRSPVIGRPLALLALQKSPRANATVTVCHTGTPDPRPFARQADILVAAMGQPEKVTSEWIKPGAIVIDVGIHTKGDSLVGDVLFQDASQVASLITPVPGGVGAMTVTMLLHNLLMAVCDSAGEKRPAFAFV